MKVLFFNQKKKILDEKYFELEIKKIKFYNT